MIDMHNHILFGVDDGAKTIEDSIELINYEIDNNINSIILTPHYNINSTDGEKDRVLQNYVILKKTVEIEKLNIKLFLGNEIYLGTDFYEVLEKKAFITLAGSDYILIEFNLLSNSINIAEMCYEVRKRGYIPIIAHIERYINLYNDRTLLEDILEEGALLQVNASSLLHKDDEECFKFANFLLKSGLVSFVASDVHSMQGRVSCLNEAYKIVKKNCGATYADMIFNTNQIKVLSNEYIDTPLIKEEKNLINKLIKKLFVN